MKVEILLAAGQRSDMVRNYGNYPEWRYNFTNFYWRNAPKRELMAIIIKLML